MPLFNRDKLSRLWKLLGPYWKSEERWVGRGLFFGILFLTVAGVYLDVLLNEWNGVFYNALQDKNYAEFTRLIGRFAILATFAIIFAVYSIYLKQLLQIRWRRWLTNRYLVEWMKDRAYYRMQLAYRDTDNPDQRIAEDLRIFVDTTLGLTFGLIGSVLTLVSFAGILWGLSGAHTFALGSSEYEIYGYMVWVALVYAIVGTTLTHFIGRPLIQLNFDQQRFEADFRFSLVRLRENAEGVALYGGEKQELNGLHSRFDSLVKNWWALAKRTKQLTWLNSGYHQIAIIFPFVVAAPRYFAGSIPLGGLMQTASAFGQVQSALSWFVDAYGTFATWRATVDRLTTFDTAIERTQQQNQHSDIQRTQSGTSITADQLLLATPDGRALFSVPHLEFKRGERIVLTGPSGSGKSTLFRTLAGIWPFGHGKVSVPGDAKALFLPQKPYLPIASLRAAISFPASADAFSTEAIQQALKDCRIGELAGRLDEVQHWSQALSPGEQQRIAVARALLHKPDWLFLDEATSALDEETEAALNALLDARLKDTTIVSISHRPGQASLHQRGLRVQKLDGSTEMVLA